MSSDEAIQLTNNDASNFKSYAVSKGYWSDPYVGYFALNTNNVEHKPPEMSRGYFARVNAIRSIIFKFLTTFDNVQIINLGAGYDTLYFNLIDGDYKFKKYVEVDFPKVVSSKIKTIRTKKNLADRIVKPVTDEIKPAESKQDGDFKVPFQLPKPLTVHPALRSNSEIHIGNYDLISVDLRNLKEFEQKLKTCEIDFNLPTLVVAECVLVYMEDAHSSALLNFLTDNFKKVAFANYEQVNLNDKFGEIMLANMEARACKLLGTESCASIESQMERFISNGFNKEFCQILTMTNFYTNKMDQKERARIESIEFLDETELLYQLMDHYCLCIASNSEEFKRIFF